MNNNIIIGIILAAIASAAAIFYSKKKSDQKAETIQKQIENTLNEAKEKANKTINNAHLEGQKIIETSRKNVEEEIKTRRESINQIETRLTQKETLLDEKENTFSKKEMKLQEELIQLKNLQNKEKEIIEKLSEKLEKISGLSQKEAEELLLSNIERKIKDKSGKLIKEYEEKAKKIADKKAKEIIITAIQRSAVDHVSNTSTSIVNIPDDDMKGRIIGKEGRNIRAIETQTGVDVIIDDTPGAVILSCFDPIRREIAKIALKNLVADGRIQPTRIEEVVEKAKKEIQAIIIEKGEETAEKVNLQFHPKIIELLGRLHYRTSYGQNILEHSIESATIAGSIAQQLDVNVNLAKRGALLHDIGKAIDFEVGGCHDDLGKEYCLKYGESDTLINCIMAHHEGEEPETIEAIIVMVADAISSVRPGARKESAEKYVKRLTQLETLASEFDGVNKTFAIQAGREVRVIVNPLQITDNEMKKLAFDIANKIESEVDYPGEVKVSIIRETKASYTAK